jgi:O-antigen/teichoic acid export membrane protein
MLSNAVFVTSLPIVSELHDKESMVQLGSFYRTMTKWGFTLNLPLFLISVMFAKPILSIFGQGFVDGVMVLTILAGARLVDAGLGMGGALIDMTGHTRVKLVNAIFATCMVFGLSFLLVPSLGMVGAACVVLAETAIVGLACVVEVNVLLRLLPYDLHFVKPVIAGVMAVAAALAMNKLLPAEAGLASLAINVAMLSVVYAGAILLLGLSQEDRVLLARLRERVGSRLSRR